MELLSTGKRSGKCKVSIASARIALLATCVIFTGADFVCGETLIRKGSLWHILRGTTEASSPSDAWRQPGFDDGAWPLGATPFRYGDGTDGTLLGDMSGSYSTLFARQEFEIGSADSIVGMELELDYDDGVIVWLNGVEAARLNAADEDVDSFATTGHESGVSETFSLVDSIDLLVAGTNIIAMQGFNVALESSDFLLEAKLKVTRASAPLITRDSVWSFKRGTEEASLPIDAWRTAEFDDSDWEEGATPIGYGHGDETTVLTDMQDGYSTVFLRKRIDIADLKDLNFVDIRADADDTYVLWVNGVRVLDGGRIPAAIEHDSLAKLGHPRGTIDELRLQNPADFFVDGLNVVALQIFNVKLSSSDLWAWVEMTALSGVDDTNFSVKRGFFTDSFEVEVTTATPGAGIRYTLDGTAPSETSGELYEEPIQITTTTTLRAIAFKDGLDSSNVDTQTYIFPADVLEQPRFPDGVPTSWPSSLAREGVADYEMDPGIVNHTQYRNKIGDALLSIPTMSLVLDPDDIFGSDGVYHNGHAKDNLNNQFERPVSMEIIYPDGSKGEQVNCGLRPHSHVGKKRSFKLAFKRNLGAAKLKFDLFRTSPLNSESAESEFDRLVLRAGHNRSWANDSNPEDSVYARDQWIRDTQIAASGFGAHGMFVHLYINGLYWGLYNPVERPDAFFSSTYFGGVKEEWFATNHNGPIDGDTTQYDRIYQLASNGQLGQTGPYREISRLLELPTYADHLIVNWYAGIGDWPANNYYAGHAVTPPGPLRFYAWDGEECWDALSHSKPDRSSDGAWVHPDFRGGAPIFRTQRALSSWVWHAIIDNPDFMTLFADRVYALCFQGPLTETASRQRWTAISQYIRDAVICESARWGDAVSSQARTLKDDWEPEYLRVRNQSMVGNVSQFLSVLRAEGYYPTANPATFNSSGGLVPKGFQLSLVPPSNGGRIYYTTDQSDPRMPGGAIAATASRYQGSSIEIDAPTVVKTRTRRSGEWSAMSQETFYTPQTLDNLRVTEVMYHPPNIGLVDGDEFEFFELKNIGNEAIDVSGAKFVEGITFEFELGTTIGPDEFVVLVRNEIEFGLRYPGVPSHGIYQKQLSNSGEEIRLTDALDNDVFTLTYADSTPWPEAADGDGYSMVPIDPVPVADQNVPELWRRSADLAGSPGRDDPDFDPPASPDCNGNGVLDAEDIASGFSEDVDANGLPDDCVPPAPTGPDCNGNGVNDANDINAGVSEDVDGNDVPDECSPPPPPPPSPDCNENGVLDASDLVSGFSEDVDGNGVPDECDPPQPPPSPDCNENGVLDANDIVGGFSDDVNGNGVPDECDPPPPPPPSPDCNENGVLDANDIVGGFSNDINGNGVPDECEPAPSPDCNENGVPDVEDISGGTSTDGNLNGIPDECDAPSPDCNENSVFDVLDILSGFSRDTNGNAVPDECESEPPLEFVSFIRGDANRDGRVDVSDAITTVDFVFQGIGILRCPDATDANDDGSIDLADPIYSVNYFFINGPAPRPPFPSAGYDPTADLLEDCEF